MVYEGVAHVQSPHGKQEVPDSGNAIIDAHLCSGYHSPRPRLHHQRSDPSRQSAMVQQVLLLREVADCCGSVIHSKALTPRRSVVPRLQRGTRVDKAPEKWLFTSLLSSNPLYSTAGCHRLRSVTMLVTALVVAGLGLLPVRAWDKPVWQIDSLGLCGPALNAHKKCVPDKITTQPILWICKAAQGTWEPTDELCEMKIRQDDEHQTADGDWHIGCDEPGHCGYYQDHPNKRSINRGPNSSARLIPARMSSQESLDPDWLNIPDRDGIDTRCSLTSIELVEKFNGEHWVHHYKCPPGTSCTDILGSGACRAGPHEFTIPGRSYLWTFDCPDALEDPSSCHFSDSMHSYGAPKPYKPYLTGTTRCNPNGRAVQYFDGDEWKDVYSCKAEASCVEREGRGGCLAGQSLSYPLNTRKSIPSPPVKRDDITSAEANRDTTVCDPDSDGICFIALGTTYHKYVNVVSEDNQPPTRCHPKEDGRVQFFSEWYHKWVAFHTCEYPNGCHNWMGKAQCEDEDQIIVPFVELPNGVEGWHPNKASDRVPKPDDVLPPIQQKIAQAEGTVHTRCEPLDDTSKLVEYLHPTAQQWLRFYECGGRCVQFPEFAACEEYTDKFVIPNPPTESITKRDALQNLDSRLLRRQVLQNAKAPDFHTIDTRCNPFDLNEVQRYNGTHWIHHYQCTFLGSCIDVDGHGACRLQDNVYELPSANRTSVKHGEGENPLRVKTRCNKSNATEVLEWQGHSWEPQSVCLPPFECFDFDGRTDFALCVHNDAQYRRMWLPWPALSRSINSGQVTRCKDQERMEQFKDNAWVPYRRCNGMFKCQDVEGGPNGGCAAPSLYDILTQPRIDIFRDPASRVAAPQLPKRGGIDDSLLKYSEMPTEQGKILISEGEDLTEQSNPFLETFFGPRDKAASIEDFAAMDNHNSDIHSSSLNAKKPRATVVSDAAGNRAIRRRNTGGLIDESVGMHKQGAHLIEKGNKLVNQGGGF
ncbi:hypothetical protein PSPO01_14004 [Paraphaeosphaeria sporulosa]